MPHSHQNRLLRDAVALEYAVLSLIGADAEAAARSGRDGLATRRDGLTSLTLAAAIFSVGGLAAVSTAQQVAVRRALNSLERRGLVEPFGRSARGVVWISTSERERLRALTRT